MTPNMTHPPFSFVVCWSHSWRTWTLRSCRCAWVPWTPWWSGRSRSSGSATRPKGSPSWMPWMRRRDDNKTSERLSLLSRFSKANVTTKLLSLRLRGTKMTLLSLLEGHCCSDWLLTVLGDVRFGSWNLHSSALFVHHVWMLFRRLRSYICFRGSCVVSFPWMTHRTAAQREN